MEFWGVEVKSGESLSVSPGEHMIVHISQVALGKKENNGNESVRLHLKVAGQKELIIGTLSHEKFPQLATEIVIETSFELSHTWSHGSVYFTGYKVDASDSFLLGNVCKKQQYLTDEEYPAAPAPAPVAPVRQVNFKLPSEDVKANRAEVATDSDSSDDDDSSSEEDDETEEVKVVPAAGDNAEDESDGEEDDSSDEETPKKIEPKKRSAEASTSNNAVSNKKAKFITPQKSTESKKPHVHVATPHPSKGVKSSGSNGEASKTPWTPKSAGAFGCKSCNRTFTSEMGLQSHSKAKHSAAA